MSTSKQLTDFNAYDRLVRLFNEQRVAYRLIEHEPEGKTEAASRIRGHDLAQAAKCLVIVARPDKKTRLFLLAVVPGDRRVSLGNLKETLRLRSVGFAPRADAERLAGSVVGSITPFAFHPELELVVDEELLQQEVLYFNAGRLDLSLAVSVRDYVRITRPRTARIAE